LKAGISLSRIYRFTSAHRLHSEKLTERENLAVYDKCNNYNGHGHDYTVEISLSGEPDPVTGMIIPLDEFDGRANTLLRELDYKHLDKEVPYFKGHLSTGENIIQYLWDRLKKIFPDHTITALMIRETSSNYFEIKNNGENI